MSGSKAVDVATQRSAQEECLLAAATDVFLEKGFSATSIDEIAASAKASKITFYNRFRNKDNSSSRRSRPSARSQVAHRLHSQKDGQLRLREAEPDLAAEHFMHLALGELSRRMLLGLVPPRKDQIEKRFKSPLTSSTRLQFLMVNRFSCSCGCSGLVFSVIEFSSKLAHTLVSLSKRHFDASFRY